ncbi:MAG: putative transposase [Gammaproteobacteria bacterium]|jgi:putative transposase
MTHLSAWNTFEAILAVIDHSEPVIEVSRVHDCVIVCRMFNSAAIGEPLSKHISTDHDPLFQFHRGPANLRVDEIDEVKSIPVVPVLQPFIERLIGTVRREYFDRVFFWNTVTLTRKLEAYRDYYNVHRIR